MGVPITVGLLAYAEALLMTKNYALLTPFIFTSIIVGYVVSITRYGEEVNEVCLVGVITIVIGILFIVRNKEKH
jgi:drug/metabolite transporter (DMT)-like permease